MQASKIRDHKTRSGKKSKNRIRKYVSTRKRTQSSEQQTQRRTAIHSPIERRLGFDPIEGIVQGESEIVTYILEQPHKKMVAIAEDLYKILRKQKHKFDIHFTHEDAWPELLTYLINSIESYIGKDELMLNTEDGHYGHYCLVSSRYHRTVERQTGIEIIYLAIYGRKNKPFYDVMMSCLTYLHKIVGVAHTGSLEFTDLSCTLEYIAENLDGQEEDDRRDMKKALHRNYNGIANRYIEKLNIKHSQIPKLIKGIKKQVLDYLALTECKKEKALLNTFLKIFDCRETLNDYQISKDRWDESPIPVNTAFIINWRIDPVTQEQGHTLDNYANEYGIQELVTQHPIRNSNGRINWNIKHECNMPTLLETFFEQYDNLLIPKLKTK